MRTRVYVDGLNLYYGALKNTPFKWLNLVELAYQLLPAEHNVDSLSYFTARVSGVSDAGAPARQHAYLRALNTVDEIEVYFGNFLAKTVWRPLTNLPVANKEINTPTPVTLPEGNLSVAGTQTLPVGRYGPRKRTKTKRSKINRPLPDAVVAEIHTMEEEGSDVNLAAHLLNDAWKGLFDVAVVISNDTDLVTPIRMVTAEQKRTVYVVCPMRWRIAPKLEEVATYVRHLRPAMLKASQFPDVIPGTMISKPATW